MARASKIRQLKIILAGDKDTGKHCYIRRLIDNKFPRDSWTNKESDSWPLQVKIDETTEVSLQIDIIRGTERGKSILKKIYRNIDGYIIMFDVTNPESYDNIPGWKKCIDEENKSRQLPCILLANKCDLEKDREIKEQMDGINFYCEYFGFRTHFETSSKDNIAIQQSIQHLIREILGNNRNPPVLESNPLSRSRSPSSLSETRSPTPPTVPKEHKLKIIVIGELTTGKTSIIQRYTKNIFSTHYRSTIGTDIGLKKTYHNDAILVVQIWDISGSERFGSMTHLFYRDAAGCIVVFDVSRPSTLDIAIRWKEDFDAKVNYDSNHQVPCLLVGNKCDLPKDGIAQNETDMTNFCHTHKFIRWFETSAKTNTNIAETFSFLYDEIMKSRTDGRRRRRHSSEVIIVGDTHSSTDNTHKTCCKN